jgi:hypothetical protein
MRCSAYTQSTDPSAKGSGWQMSSAAKYASPSTR